MDGPDRICIRGLRLVGHCGVLPEERERPQPLEIDLDVMVDQRTAGVTDDLADAVDYGELSLRVATVVTDSRFGLLEHAAQVVADTVLADERVEGVTVAIRKLRPPVPLDMASSGVAITRTRE